MTIEFAKYHGTGNDFILIDGRTLTSLPDGNRVAQLCHRRFGIGADGLIIVGPATDADYTMQYFNADGRISSMCGNGARCAFLFAQRIGLVTDHADFFAFDGKHTATRIKNGAVMISMRDVLSVIRKSGDVFILDTGSPHFVQLVGDLDTIDAFQLGRDIRNLPDFIREGINVNFAQQSGDHVRVRTYERGVEDITLSCGTGVTAVALACALKNGLSNGPLHIETDGGRLSVDFCQEGTGFKEIYLSGPAVYVYDGVVAM